MSLITTAKKGTPVEVFLVEGHEKLGNGTIIETESIYSTGADGCSHLMAKDTPAYVKLDSGKVIKATKCYLYPGFKKKEMP